MGEKHNVDFSVDNLSITLLCELLDNMAKGDTVDFKDLSREEVRFIKSALEMYATVGEKLDDIHRRVKESNKMIIGIMRTPNSLIGGGPWQRPSHQNVPGTGTSYQKL